MEVSLLEKLVKETVQAMRDAGGTLDLGNYTPLKPDLVEKTHYYKIVMPRMRAKGLITQPNINNAGVFTLTEYGWSFTGFEQERLGLLRESELRREQTTSVINTNKLTMLNIYVTIFLGILIAIIQYKTNERENRREVRELNKLYRDSLESLQQKKSDSVFQKSVLRIIEEKKDSSKK